MPADNRGGWNGRGMVGYYGRVRNTLVCLVSTDILCLQLVAGQGQFHRLCHRAICAKQHHRCSTIPLFDQHNCQPTALLERTDTYRSTSCVHSFLILLRLLSFFRIGIGTVWATILHVRHLIGTRICADYVTTERPRVLDYRAWIL